MKVIIGILLGFFFNPGNTQPTLKVFGEKKPKGHILYASNGAFCPQTISLELDLTNLNFSEVQQRLFVIPAKTDKFKVGELNVVNPREGNKYSFRYIANYGDITLKIYDTSYAYDLPYQRGKGYFVSQGYKGELSHKDENALDFTMPEGSEILAARDGIVIKVIQNNTESCAKEECKRFNNSVIIYHNDGTFAEYLHIKYNGSKVSEGDRIKKGDLIAYSGNTGWSTGPHLHFSCSLPGVPKRPTIETKFKINDGSKSDYLKVKETYLKLY